MHGSKELDDDDELAVLLDEADDDDELVVLLDVVTAEIDSGAFPKVGGTSLLAESVPAHDSNPSTNANNPTPRTIAETFILPSMRDRF